MGDQDFVPFPGSAAGGAPSGLNTPRILIETFGSGRFQ
jgi:hypothetical protein